MRNALVILFIFLLLAGCKKGYRYEEDPKKSKSSPQARLHGNWKITHYTFNGVNIYDELNQKAIGNCNLDKVLLQYVYYKKNSLDYNSGARDAFNIYPFSDASKKDAFNDYTYLKISNIGGQDALDSLYTYWFVSPKRYNCWSAAYWRVTKLYENDFHIVLKTDSGEYKMELVKTKI